jgi:hypothetical protein
MSALPSSSPMPPLDAQQIISDLERLTQQFKTWIESDPKIGLLDQISVNNHLALLHMCFGKWKAQQEGRSREVKNKPSGGTAA